MIEQLVKLRTMMEKMKPIEQKLKYQIEKLLKLAAQGAITAPADDPLTAKPRPEALVAPSEDNESNVCRSSF